ncbi:MAG: hypothetical protein WC470_03665 [Candidatus Paceibacterota bacterium]
MCNCNCCKNVNKGKIFLSAVIFMVIAFVVDTVAAQFTMGYYMMEQYFSVWSKVMMPIAGPPPMSFFAWSLLFSFISGLVLASLYEKVKQSLGQTFWQKVCCFTCTIVSLYVIFFMLPLYLLINLPIGLLVAWLISAVVVYFFSSIAFVKIME